MGYACPVCDEPQRDAEHLANHLAFQAMTHGGDHETWLDAHAPDWASGGPAALAPRVAAFAPDADYEVVFEDTAGDARDGTSFDPDLQGEPTSGDRTHGHGYEHGHDPGHGHEHGDGRPHTDAAVQPSDLDPETRGIVENARTLTREMLADETDADTDVDADTGADADTDTGADADADTDD